LDEDREPIEPITVDESKEDAAVRYVIERERRLGREARDTRRRPGAPDIESGDRMIELKVVGRWLRTRGVLLFTPGQIRKAEQQADYYVYIVENLDQGDPSKFEVRVLHGDDLRRLCAGAKQQRVYVPVHVGDYAKLPRLDE
jgi:hypothetical protein